MSFRRKLFLSIVVAVMLTATIEAGLDYLYDAWYERLATRTQADLAVFAASAIAAVDLEGTPLRLDDRALELLPRLRGERMRIVYGDEVALTYGGLYPDDVTGWATYERFLGFGYRLEAALPLGVVERVLGSNLLLDLLDLPLFFALAFGVALMLTRHVMRPVGELTTALQQISRQQFPEPVSVPDGNDELSDMARSFNAMSASIESLIERERSFTRYASHELRTPLSALKVHTEALELGLSTPEDTVPVLRRNVERMEAVLTALLALARSADHDPAPVGLRALVRETVDGVGGAARHRVRLIDRAGDAPRVTDGSLVRHAIGNLIENALKYSQGPVTVLVDAADGTATVRVCDEGPGIAPADLDTVRRPFVRGASDGPGLGLGLALTDNVARSIRGRLELVNTDDGLEAAFTVPLAPATTDIVRA